MKQHKPTVTAAKARVGGKSNAATEVMSRFCLDHNIPVELWQINYSDGSRQERRRLKLPAAVGHIKFPKLIERLDNEISECSMNDLTELRAAEEQGLACVKLVGWLLEHGCQ
jgi:hypothetical protein